MMSDPADADDLDAQLERAGRLYAGRIVQINPHRGTGRVKSDAGGTFSFDLTTARVEGIPARRLRKGQRVGFDLTHTRRGPVVSRLWPS